MRRPAGRVRLNSAGHEMGFGFGSGIARKGSLRLILLLPGACRVDLALGVVVMGDFCAVMVMAGGVIMVAVRVGDISGIKEMRLKEEVVDSFPYVVT